jgi:hypothetical protein
MLYPTGKCKGCDVKSLRNGENHEDSVYDGRYPNRGSNTKLVLLHTSSVSCGGTEEDREMCEYNVYLGWL